MILGVPTSEFMFLFGFIVMQVKFEQILIRSEFIIFLRDIFDDVLGFN